MSGCRRLNRVNEACRSGFTLIEVVIMVIVLGLAVPPTLSLLDSASSGRVDAINTARATFLSTMVLETVLADMTSSQENLGFSALADSAVYLNQSGSGLYDRLAPLVRPYSEAGFTYTVTIGELVSSTGQVSGTPSENIFRMVTVNVAYSSASGSSFLMPTVMMVSEM